MRNYGHKFLVIPGKKVKLKHVDSGWRDKFDSHKGAVRELQKYLDELDALQYMMYAENEHSLLIVLQGLDAAGKDGVIRHVLTGMNPQGCTVTGFKQPTPEELDHDFLWRVHAHAPRKGGVAIYNRSHYEDVLSTRVHKAISKGESYRRYGLINEFEKLLIDESKTTILKFFLHISKEEQLNRFGARLKDPSRHWKISEGDYLEREYWDDYTRVYEEVLCNTSTERAPWYIIPSDYKWFRNLAISQIIAGTLEGLKMKIPRPSVDIDEIRRKYHTDVKKERAAKGDSED